MSHALTVSVAGAVVLRKRERRKRKTWQTRQRTQQTRPWRRLRLQPRPQPLLKRRPWRRRDCRRSGVDGRPENKRLRCELPWAVRKPIAQPIVLPQRPLERRMLLWLPKRRRRKRLLWQQQRWLR